VYWVGNSRVAYRLRSQHTFFHKCATHILYEENAMNGTVKNEHSEDAVLYQLSFDGESCTYEGPTELTAGPVTLLFINESKERAAVNLLKHTGDETIQDMIEYIGEEPTTKHHPSWTRELGTWKPVLPGESYTWRGILESGTHTIGCARLNPLGVWFGGGFVVKD
jgi:hypothetical protein